MTSSSTGLGVGVKGAIGSSGLMAGVNVEASASGARSSGGGTSHTNAVVRAGDTLYTSSGRDTTVAGAHLEGDTVWMDVGGNLTVASLQDHSESQSSSWSAGGGVTAGSGVSASANLGGSHGSGTAAWTDEQTSVIGHEEVDIWVEKNTHIQGAVIGAENGELTLDTGTLTYETVRDRDHGSRTGINLGLGLGGSDNDGDGFAPTPDSLEVSYAEHDKEGVLFPTVGEGTIIVRDDPGGDARR